ncbi:MAG: pyridoxal-phosphate dependent enzyme [Arachidicoccus sp.]|nr:pyridoxal-phosphate dependent enzyme [Arachidicoccus sp.]
MNFQQPAIINISPHFAVRHKVSLDILRLDLIHPVISGNKWYKLKYYLQHAIDNKATGIATFGGAFSNHILAAACAAQINGLKSFGIIRGEKPKLLSHTLKNAVQYGMELYFISRKEYDNKEMVKERLKDKDLFWIDEGGYGTDGAKGASEILDGAAFDKYSHIVVAAGTGTTFAGLIKKIKPHQQVIGISVMKNNYSLREEINSLLNNNERKKNFRLFHDFHFGGYAKNNDKLINYMNIVYESSDMPLDFVYTAKAFYGLQKLTEEDFIPSGSKILFVHTGGLQGNLSLPKGVLKF